MTPFEQQLLGRRQGYLERWAQLKLDDRNTAERFGALVQHVVEAVYLDAAWSQPSEQARRRAVLDDLVDLFVSPRFALFKRVVMSSPTVLDTVITDEKADRRDFHPSLQPGGGRFRHIAMNAAAAERYPPLMVNLAARAVGYDVPWRRDPSGDTDADLAANRIGRDFARYLKTHPIGELAADAEVQDWLRARLESG